MAFSCVQDETCTARKGLGLGSPMHTVSTHMCRWAHPVGAVPLGKRGEKFVMASDKYPSPSESEVPRRTLWLSLALPHLVPRDESFPVHTPGNTILDCRKREGQETDRK